MICTIEGQYERFQQFPNERILILKHGQRLIHPLEQRCYQVFSLTSWAIKADQCPIHTTKLAGEQNHQLHFLIAIGLNEKASYDQDGEFIEIRLGDKIRLEGRFFSLILDEHGLALAEATPSDDAAPGAVAKSHQTLINNLLTACELAEDFMAGFEDDESQTGINERLHSIRNAIATTRAR